MIIHNTHHYILTINPNESRSLRSIVLNINTNQLYLVLDWTILEKIKK